MGLLDDAIRDHLDLKRRRGADPSDIERAEQEALGPVRRDPFERGPDDFESVPVAENGLRAYDHEGEQYDDEASEEYDVEEEWEEGFEDQPLEPGTPQFGAGEVPEPHEGELSDPTRLMDYEALDAPPPPLPDASSDPPPYQTETRAGDETMQYDVEDALAAESGQTEPEPEWVEDSDEWAEPSREPVEPPPADKAPTFEPSPDEHEPPHRVESDETDPGAETDAPDQDVQSGRTPETGPHEAKADDHVLEETPEFLEDAPDRDRLWFEQRPPKDFDFDG